MFDLLGKCLKANAYLTCKYALCRGRISGHGLGCAHRDQQRWGSGFGSK